MQFVCVKRNIHFSGMDFSEWSFNNDSSGEVQLDCELNRLLNLPIPDVDITQKGVIKTCYICCDDFVDMSRQSENPTCITFCQHIFHVQCLKTYIETTNDKPLKCPYCRSQLYTLETARILKQFPYARLSLDLNDLRITLKEHIMSEMKTF